MFTKEQRREVYILALQYLNGEESLSLPYIDEEDEKQWATNSSGICELIQEAVCSLNLKKNYSIRFLDFPEFYSFLPEKTHEGLLGFWWPMEDREIRKYVLQKCIKMTKDESRINT